MLILVSGSTRTVRQLAERKVANLGALTTPANRNSLHSLVRLGLPWAMDNGAYSGFDEKRFRRKLKKCVGLPRLLWVACPDLVGDAKGTLALFGGWREEIAGLGLPIALVGQDGVENLNVPWDSFGAWFIGGSTKWKLSQASVDMAAEASKRGKWVHVGRVNSLRRLQWCHDIGADSVDGSSLSMFGDKYIHKFCSWARGLAAQPTLFCCR